MFTQDKGKNMTSQAADLPPITSPNSKLKTLGTLNDIHKQVSSILNPKFEQCRFLCPITQIISEDRHRVVLFALIYHRQNGGEYAVFIFNEDLKLRECIPIKKYSFFLQLNVLQDFSEKVESNDYDEYDDEEEEKIDRYLATNTRVTMYHVGNELEIQNFVFSCQSDEQLLNLLLTMTSVCSHRDLDQTVGFDQIFDLPLEFIGEESEQDKSSNLFKPPTGYQFMTSTATIQSRINQSNNLFQISQQFASFKQQLQNTATQVKSQSQASSLSSTPQTPGSRRMSAKLTSSPGSYNDKRKSQNLNFYMTALHAQHQQQQQQQTKTTGTNTPIPFEWVLFFIERYELDENEIEFLNPLYHNMQSGEKKLLKIEVVEKKKENIAGQDAVTITPPKPKNNSDQSDRDEYLWLLKRTEEEVSNHIQSISRKQPQQPVVSPPTTTVTSPNTSTSPFATTVIDQNKQVINPRIKTGSQAGQTVQKVVIGATNQTSTSPATTNVKVIAPTATKPQPTPAPVESDSDDSISISSSDSGDSDEEDDIEISSDDSDEE